MNETEQITSNSVIVTHQQKLSQAKYNVTITIDIAYRQANIITPGKINNENFLH